MTDQIPYIRVFISSPGDVNDERKIALEVIEQFPYRASFRDRVAFRIVAWDKPGAGTPMRATLTPQDAINQGLPMPSQCDIVIVLFWSRMGTPFVHTDGVEYQSGTYWELMNALEADRPETVIYRRTDEPSFKPTDPKFEDKVAQYRKVETFFKSKLFYDADGRIQRGINVYNKPDDFRRAFELDFEVLVLDILKRLEQHPDTYDNSDLPETENIETKATEAWNPERSPFPGLRAFTEDDADIFFGRGAETDALISQLTDNRFVAVIASSGSGKSSLVGAGLIPRLRVNTIEGSKDWKIARFTPAENPFDGLFNAMVTAFPQLKPNPLEARRIKNNFIDDMREAPQALLDICADLLADEAEWVEILLFIDQFEELFTLANRDDAQKFVNLLNTIADDSRIRVVVTMRADFYQSALEYPKLADLLRRGSFPLAIPRESALRQMIESPAERAKIIFEADLIDRILDDVGDEPGNLALMAYALDELYKLDDDGILTFAEYESLGGVRGAIGTRADTLWASLELDESVLHRLFLQLIEVNEHGVATRRRADIQTGDNNDDTTRLMTAFTKSRLLTMDYNDETETATVEVAHEAILREWHTLRDWIDKQSANFRIVARMRRDAQWWESTGKRDQDLPRAEQTDEFFEACINLGLTITGETEPLLAEFAQDERERLIQSLATGDIDQGTVDFVMYRLRQIDGDITSAYHSLLSNTTISKYSVRTNAVKSLGNLNDERSITPLITLLKHDEDPSVRSNSATALGKLGNNDAILSLIDSLKIDKENYVRQECAKALGGLGDKQAVLPLIDALSDADKRVREDVIEALGKLNDKRATLPLVDLLNDENTDIRSVTIDALIQLQDNRAILPLIGTLSYNEIDMRKLSNIVESLGKLGNEQAVLPLIEALENTAINSQVRSYIARALSQLRDDRAVLPLIRSLKDTTLQNVRWAIVDALGDFEDERVVLPIIEVLKDENSYCRTITAETLGKLGDDRAILPLIETLGDREREVSSASMGALAQLNVEKIIKPLTDKLNNTNDEDTRITIIVALGELLGSYAVPQLIDMLQDESVKIIMQSAFTLGNIGDIRAFQPLLDILNHNHDWIRGQSAISLGQLGDERAVQPLIELLNDEDGNVRKSSIQALGQLGDERAVQPLIELLNDEDGNVRESSIQALEQLGDERAIQPLIELFLSGPLKRKESITTIKAIYNIKPESLNALQEFDIKSIILYMSMELRRKWGNVETKQPVLAALRIMKHPMAQEAVAKWDAEHGDEDAT